MGADNSVTTEFPRVKRDIGIGLVMISALPEHAYSPASSDVAADPEVDQTYHNFSD